MFFMRLDRHTLLEPLKIAEQMVLDEIPGNWSCNKIIKPKIKLKEYEKHDLNSLTKVYTYKTDKLIVKTDP